jgi:hypothetical protein
VNVASGPHLDYRVQQNGRWIDPLTLKSVRDEPIPSSQLASFRSWKNEVLASLQRGTPSPNLRIPGAKAPETVLAVQDGRLLDQLDPADGQLAR